MSVTIHNVDNIASAEFIERLVANTLEIEKVIAPKSSGYEPDVARILGCSDKRARYWDMIDEFGVKYEIKKGQYHIICNAVRYSEMLLSTNLEATEPSITILIITKGNKRITTIILVESKRLIDAMKITPEDAHYHIDRFAKLRETGLSWNSQILLSLPVLQNFFDL